MEKLKLYSWNVNGIRASIKKGIVEWINKEQPDIFCTQETKAQFHQLPESIINVSGYTSYWNSAEKPGYSGVSIHTRSKPENHENGMGAEEFDHEGRTLMMKFQNFTLYNVYFPNGQSKEERLKYKLEFYDEFLKIILKKKEDGEKIVICGDFNTAHHEIDLARPKENINNSGFLPIEREWLDQLVDSGFIDCYREFNQESGNYTFWDTKTRARDRNIGWRIDYFFIDEQLKSNLISAEIMNGVFGSDHCPIAIELYFD
ncbi:MAG: exodeoxyribonuclease III [SAR202 cluster bacterium]|jgi:exodeoxyribonuclease-3|nr:exodeoxyribonuclease III [Dehalococcoidia bacterium]MQG85076.1 exodeoxyribonuclease III [SAR202 cluster bacterium]|tara:strand:+ start:3839 stop:4615 length:777 start_codon:yes stop_codon:yes gene_type:complete